MRIIAGKYRGLQLVSFSSDQIRPTTDRMKETLFNILMNQTGDSRVVDLFAGTGNLGLEALSREAAHVTFVEKNSKSLQVIRENLKKLKVPNESFEIKAMDVFSFLKAYEGPGFNLVFADPPFTEKLTAKVLKEVSESPILAEGGIFVLESAKKDQPAETCGDLLRYDTRDFGDKVLSFFAKKSDK